MSIARSGTDHQATRTRTWARREQAAEIVAHFTFLIHARLTGQRANATRANDNLRRLGIEVRFAGEAAR